MRCDETSGSIGEGDAVRLLELPERCLRQDAYVNLTIGNVYSVLYLDGSNVVTTTDVPGEEASYWRGRCVRTTR